ncbi:MAG: DUF3300 domain-containing protein [Phycisphaerales bacterium JB039]
MKRRCTATLILALLAAAGPVSGQEESVPPPAQPGAAQPEAAAQPGPGALTSAELEELVGPIALYPDPLLANVLGAAVYPDEVRRAAIFARDGGDPKYLETLDWEPPVKAIALIPDVARMMGEYLQWTIALGQAYLTQAEEVMAAVQSLRQKAMATGALQTTSEQKVTTEADVIVIEPANPDIIYVPYYDPAIVYWYDDDDDYDAWIGFGTGIIVGIVWADLICDWDHGCIGWGWGHTDIDIDIGEINIDRDRVEHHARVGREGGAWAPNRDKPIATNRPDQRPRFRAATSPQAPASARAQALPRTSSAAAAPARPGTRPGAGGARTQAPSAARQPGYRVPPTPTDRYNSSAFRGGADTRAASSRGSSSRQSAQRSSGGSRAPARGGGGRRGGGRR